MSDPQRQIVLCFDGTGNTFRGNDTGTNILRICRMLERTDEQLCYYQPGIGTDTTPGSLASTTIQKGSTFGSSRTLELALGKSFDRHVLGGYRFLMRHYKHGAKIYIFGFSRGGYTARFLAEMLDYTGLLGPDNEEVLPFVWDAFTTWKLARFNDSEAQLKAFSFLKHLRETLCRPTTRVQFLGMFDAVNSIAEFEVNVDNLPSAKTIRHAVSIDERRIKFRPVLLHSPNRRVWPRSSLLLNKKLAAGVNEKRPSTDIPHKETLGSTAGPSDTPEKATESAGNVPGDDVDDDDAGMQDLEEVWFPGGHSDIGGGWGIEDSERCPLNHTPLVWIVREAIRAGIRFDESKLKQFNCHEDTYQMGNPLADQSLSMSTFVEALQLSAKEGHVHDLLQYGNGLPFMSVLTWRLMEYLPFRRRDLQTDASWKELRWPPPRGGARGIPPKAQIHVSAIQRMQSDPSYRPANLIGFFQGQEGNADGPDSGIEQWVIHEYKGDPVRETYARKGTFSG